MTSENAEYTEAHARGKGIFYTQSAQILRKIRCASPLFQAQPEIADGTTNFPQGMDEERWMELLKLSGAGQLDRR